LAEAGFEAPSFFVKENGMKRMMFLIGMLALAFGMAGCYFDLGEPRPEEQETQPKAGVLTVKGVKNGTHHEAAVYDYPDDDVADAADLKDLMSRFELVAIGLGTAGNKTLALGLVTLDGENFTADGDFLVVLKQVTKDDSAPLKYKGAVPFIGGSATVEYDEMETATVEPSVSSYTVTFHTNGGTPADFTQQVQSGGKATQPAVPVRTGYTFGGWFTDAAGTGAEWDFALNTVKETVTLYAKWTQITYAVTFNAAGGTPAGIIQSVPYGSAATRPANPTREDYAFDDWYAAMDYAAKWNFDSIVTADIILYAKWKPLTLAALLADIAIDAAVNSTSASYTLPSGDEAYNAEVTLTTANSPANVVVDGGNRVVTGSTNRITVGAGVTITLKNITFKTLPFTAAAGGTLVLDDKAVIQGNAGTGITVNGGTLELKAGALVKDNHDSGLVMENNSVLTMSGGEISGNTTVNNGGGVLVKGANSVFTMGGGIIKENEASLVSTPTRYGGGVAIVDGGTFIMTDGSISANKAEYGGGVAMGDGGTFTMTGGSISANGMNLNGGYGGGVYADSDGGSFTLDGGVITGNKAFFGAGVLIEGEGFTFTMISGAISNNIASNLHYDNGSITSAAAGGVKVGAGVSFTLSGGEISGNTSEGRSGGIEIYGSGIGFHMTGGVIKNNTAVSYGGVSLSSTTTFTGNPTIGGTSAPASVGWIHGNTPVDVYYYD
jgi:uncharacterized repeat protein (TIGR02543 family)